MFTLVQQTWATKYPLFDQLLVAYTQDFKAALKKSCTSTFPTLKRWNIPARLRNRWSQKQFAEASEMKKMSRKCLVTLMYIAFCTHLFSLTHIFRHRAMLPWMA